jgi:hypothetical protein
MRPREQRRARKISLILLGKLTQYKRPEKEAGQNFPNYFGFGQIIGYSKQIAVFGEAGDKPFVGHFDGDGLQPDRGT